jgi:hypothetical protein
MATSIVLPGALDDWLEKMSGPVVLLIEPSGASRGPMGQSSVAEQCYERHAKYFDSESQAIDWYESNKPKLKTCMVSRYPVIDGRTDKS